MTNGEKFMEVFGVGCATYDVMHDITTIHRNGDWWDAEYEGEEKITDKITDNEALEILEEVMEMDDSMYQYNQRYLEALNMALEALKFKTKAGVVIEQLRADRDRLATALEEIEKEISELPNQNPSYWHDVDVLERENVLEIIRRHRKDGEDEMPEMQMH